MGAGKRFSACVAAGGDPAAAVLAALDAAESFADTAGLDARGSARLVVVVEELVANAVRHGARDGAIAFELTMAIGEGEVALVLEDDGVAFDPTAERDFSGPDAQTGGGVGLALVRAWTKALGYSRERDRNRIALRLRLD